MGVILGTHGEGMDGVWEFLVAEVPTGFWRVVETVRSNPLEVFFAENGLSYLQPTLVLLLAVFLVAIVVLLSCTLPCDTCAFVVSKF